MHPFLSLIHLIQLLLVIPLLTSALTIRPTTTTNPLRRQVQEGSPVPGKVNFCTGTNTSGDCDWRVVTFGECNALPDGFAKNTGSFMVAAGAVCYVTMNEDAAGECVANAGYAVRPPGNVDMFNVQGRDFGHAVTGFRCERCDECQTN
ncbi:hypothetical protein EJ05DRAFT_537048 [Pseudovirgaria hyperparasitica]|uniref:Uncharacterized protein n=1 Tax=Pseudovirgaria hyperparasitica TaxID=470096 RepID=A0A6A6WAD3_9PEZI|nr:uncharacterized protein EJ05DRAFT_537048 [Pseudovirgaria hyperparasitica]KAF2759818.1 hypothetical protein EJ05DRAFT_537048 [Pseudovirgaria hyperparasitica]